MATGLLVLVTGAATRMAQFYGKSEKTYLAEITFGIVSNTYDAEGEVSESGVPPPPAESILAALDQFRGSFLQTPPPVSAKKIGGVAAYKLARQNIAVELKPVEVEVTQLEVQSYYRKQAHDRCYVYGRNLYSFDSSRPGRAAWLRRAAQLFATYACRRILGCGSANAGSTRGLGQRTRLSEALIPIAQMLPEMPAEHFDQVNETHIRQGRDFRTSPFVVPPGAPLRESAVPFGGSNRHRRVKNS